MLDKLKQFITSVRTIYLSAAADNDIPFDQEVPSPKAIAEQFELINNIENLTVLGEEMGPVTVRSIKSREDYKPLLPEVMIQIDNVQQGSTRKTNLGTYYVGLRCSGWAGFAMTFYIKHKDWVTAYCEVDNPHEPYNTIEEPGYSYGLAEHPHIRGGSPCMGNFEGPIKSALNSLNFLGGIIQIKSYINSWNVNSQFTKLTYFKPKARLKINFPLFRLNDEEKVKFLNGLKEVETLNPRSTKLMTYSYEEHTPPEGGVYNKEDYVGNYTEIPWKDVDSTIDMLPEKEDKKPGDLLIRNIELSIKVPEPKLSMSHPYFRGASHREEWYTAIIDIMIRYNVSEEDAMEIMRLRLHKRNTDGNNKLLCNFLKNDKVARKLRADYRVIKENYGNNSGYSSRATLDMPVGLDRIDSIVILNHISNDKFDSSLYAMFQDYERKWINISSTDDDKRIWWVYQDSQAIWTNNTEGLYRSQMIERVFPQTTLDELFERKEAAINEEAIIEEMTSTVDKMHVGLNLLLMHQCEQSIKRLNKERKKHETKLKDIRESIPANQLAFGPLFEGGVERSSVLQEDRTE